MGIKDLRGFLDNNRCLAKVEDIYNIPIVVDASHLLYIIYQSMEGNYSSYGGDLKEFGREFRRFLENLRHLLLEPIFCLGGSSVGKFIEKDRVHSKEMKRGIERMMRAREVKEGSRCHVVPQVTKMVMADILDEYRIKRIQAPFEADGIIAALANRYECPVITGDSDFFIYRLKRGFVEAKSFYQNIKRINSTTNQLWSIVYSHDTLKTVIPDLEPEVLPLLAMLAGNDLAENTHLQDVKRSINFSTRPAGHLKFSNPGQEKIAKYFNFLRGKTFDEAKEAILELADEDHTDSISETISMMVDNYQEDHNDLLTVLSQIYPPREVSPALYLKRLMEVTVGMHNSLALDMIQSTTFYNYLNIDDWRQPSSSCVRYRPYSLAVTLLRPSSYHHLEHEERLAASAADTFYFFDRYKLAYTKIRLEPINSLDGFGPVDHFDAYTLVNLDKKTKKDLLLAAFRCSEVVYDKLQNLLFRLFDENNALEATTCFMLIRFIGLETRLRPKIEFLNAILLVLYHHLQNRDLLMPIYHDIKNKNHCRKPTSYSVYRPIVHLISQLQSAYLAFYLLNGLLQFVLPVPRLEEFFNSSQIYRLTEKMIRQETSMEELTQMESSEMRLDQVGKDILDIIWPVSELDNRNLAGNVTNLGQDNQPDSLAWIWHGSRD